MKRTSHLILLLVFTVSFLVSCNSEPTLQSYYVDNQETSNFLTVDIPPSILGLAEDNLNEDQKKALKSVKRLNFLGYRVSDTTSAALSAELSKVKGILKNDKYIDLMEFNDRSAKILVKYVGDDDSADEFIIVGSNNEIGFGIVRILGDDMKPEEMVSLVEAMRNSNLDSSKLENIMNFYK